MKNIIFTFFIAFLFIGCGNPLGPNYAKPQGLELLETKNITKADNNLTMVEWWKGYDNRNLEELILKAFANNKDISIVSKQLALALNSYDIDKSSFNPSGGVEDSFSKTNSSGKAQTTNKLGLKLSTFEFDYLGKMEKTLEIDSANIVIAKENLAVLHSTISFEIASLCGNILYVNNKLETIKKKIAILTEIKEIYKERYKNGLDTILPSLDIDGKIELEKQNYNSFEIAKENYLKALKIYIGKDENIVLENSIKPIGIPQKIASNQLEKRFDIQISEQNLIDKNAKISLVKTLYYPNISIGAFGGISGSNGSYSSVAPSWSLTPTIMWNIFDIPKVDKLVKESEIKKEQALDNYIKTVNNAFIEVQSNYDIYEKQKNQYLYVVSYGDIVKNKLGILKNKVDFGISSKLDFLELSLSYLDSQDSIDLNQNNLLQKELVLKKSIGGEVVLESSMSKASTTPSK